MYPSILFDNIKFKFYFDALLSEGVSYILLPTTLCKG